jgi:hypothetical protein
LFEALGNGLVEFEKLGQQVFFGGETVGGEDRGVQGAQATFELGQRLGADAAEFARGGGYGGDFGNRSRSD